MYLLNKFVTSFQLCDKTHLVASKDEYRPAMLGLYIKGNYCFATDSFCLSVGRLKEVHDANFTGIIPIEIVNEYWKIFKKSAYPIIKVWETKDDHNNLIQIAECNNMAYPLITESFPPVVDYLWERLTEYKASTDIFHISLNIGYLSKLAEATGKKNGQVNLLINPAERNSILYCDSEITGSQNFGFLMLGRPDNLDLNSDFWIKEFKNLLSDPEKKIKDMEEKLERIKASKVGPKPEAEENQFILEYIKKYYEEVFNEAEANFMNKEEEEPEPEPEPEPEATTTFRIIHEIDESEVFDTKKREMILDSDKVRFSVNPFNDLEDGKLKQQEHQLERSLNKIIETIGSDEIEMIERLAEEFEEAEAFDDVEDDEDYFEQFAEEYSEDEALEKEVA